ncbi:GTPase [candidate division BRC1 bacterium HGW-BRC1-1]|nr:MAG: GTPase [candidate division BRC1 bacterium HGW-BRC1-1]
MIDATETRAIATICYMAALADGTKDDPETEKLNDIFDELGGVGESSIQHRVLLNQTSLENEAALIQGAENREYTYRMAIRVCEADGDQSDEEREFLFQLRNALELNSDGKPMNPDDAQSTKETETKADEETPATEEEVEDLLPIPVNIEAEGKDPGVVAIEKLILNASILNAALELLPQTLATMAILPLQTRLVYRISKANGHELDFGHAKEFLAVLGVGVTSQVVEDFLRKIVGVLIKKTKGRAAGTIAQMATGSATAFVSTYAIGKVAQQYYSSGRTMTTDTLKFKFGESANAAKGMYEEYKPIIAENMASLDLGKIMKIVTGKA